MKKPAWDFLRLDYLEKGASSCFIHSTALVIVNENRDEQAIPQHL